MPCRGKVALGLGLVLVTAVTVSCGDDSLPLTAAGPVDARRDFEARATPLLDQLGRATALALAEPAVRQTLKLDMRDSKFAEHKIDFTSYLTRPDRAAMLNAVGRHSPGGTQGVLTALSELPGLEIYLPVRAHRNTWTGEEPVLVVVQRADDDETLPPTAFDSNGRRVSVSAETPPDIPTIAINFHETDFTSPPDRSGWLNAYPETSQVVGSWVLPPGFAVSSTGGAIKLHSDCGTEAIVECDDGGGGGGGGGGWSLPSDHTFQRGANIREYIHKMWTINDHEPWYKGAPEFKLFIAGTTNTQPTADYQITINVPEDPWCGSDDSCNATPREFGPYYLVIGEWDIDYGDRIGIKCIEQDVSFSFSELSFTFSTKILGQTVSVTAKWSGSLGDNDDDCLQGVLRLKSATTGDWTTIYNAVQNDLSFWHGTNDLRWWGYGRPIP